MAENPNPNSKLVLDDEAQSKRFIEDAKLLEVDEISDAFERAMGIVISPKSKPTTQKT